MCDNWLWQAQKLLDDILDKSIEVVTDAVHIPEKDPATSDAGVRLFKLAPQGIVFDHVGEHMNLSLVYGFQYDPC